MTACGMYNVSDMISLESGNQPKVNRAAVTVIARVEQATRYILYVSFLSLFLLWSKAQSFVSQENGSNERAPRVARHVI